MKKKKSTLKYFFSFYQADKFYFFTSIIAVVIESFITMVLPLVVGFTVDNILLGEKSQTTNLIFRFFENFGDRNFLLNNLWIIGVILIVLTSLRGLMELIADYFIAKTAENGAEKMRRTLYSHLQKLPYAWHARAETGDLVQRCTSDVEVIRRFLQIQFLQIIGAITIILASIISMISLDLPLSVVALSVTPILFVASIIYFRRRRDSFELWDETEGKLSNRLQENLSGMRIIKAFGRKKYELEQLEESHRELYNYGLKQYRIMGNFWFLSDILSNGELALIVIIGTIRVIHYGMSIGVLIVFVSYADRLLVHLRILARVIADIGKAQISFGRLKEILDAEPEPSDEGLAEPKLSGNIKFDNVTFQYPDGNEPVLKNIYMEIEAGQTIGILGPTGSGKSSLLLLLQKLYEPDSGTLSFDGIPVEEINRYSLRKQVGLILQESYIYSRSIADNIRISRPNASEKRIKHYAKIAHLDEDIKEFSRGYNTMVGERGVTLSGGQKQRLAIARTLIRDCPILIFDDSLSAVDTETDQEIRKSLRQRPDGTTTIIVSHRISSLYEADKIFVIEDGQITQKGKHRDLMSQDGLYQRVYQIQHNWLDETR
ncbi:MAG: ABC transporter ATP-binding protein [Clostridiaceae bacterium]|mgnify:CR=1 FL=1|nr:ABC transporter ATP-binding protein [Clostridiaceae bacterium]